MSNCYNGYMVNNNNTYLFSGTKYPCWTIYILRPLRSQSGPRIQNSRYTHYYFFDLMSDYSYIQGYILCVLIIRKLPTRDFYLDFSNSKRGVLTCLLPFFPCSFPPYHSYLLVPSFLFLYLML